MSFISSTSLILLFFYYLSNHWLRSWTFYIYKKFNHSEIKSDQLFLLLFQDTITNFRLWKIFPSVFAFQSTPELMFGLYLLYYFRVFERQIGSNKYSVGTLPFIFLPSILKNTMLLLLLLYSKEMEKQPSQRKFKKQHQQLGIRSDLHQ